MARFFVLALILAVGAVACANGTRDARSPDAEGMLAPAVPAPTPADPPPATPPALVQAQQPELTVAQAAANDESVDPVMAAAKQEADAEATAQAKNKAKWEKLGREADRQATDAYARDRLAKLSARGAQAQNQSSRVPAARRAKFNSDITAFATRKIDVQSRLSSLSATGSDEWKLAKAALDRALDELDAATNRLEGDLY